MKNSQTEKQKREGPIKNKIASDCGTSVKGKTIHNGNLRGRRDKRTKEISKIILVENFLRVMTSTK
jgi:hypothetical protein